MSNLCYACDKPSNVWMDSDLHRSADYCFQCFCMQSTWEDASRVFFNKPMSVKLLDLRFKAGLIAKKLNIPTPELHEVCDL